MNKKPMSFDSNEMQLKGFHGIGTVARHDDENFIIVARSNQSLKEFWARWAPGFKPDKGLYRKAIVVSGKLL